VFAFSVLVRTAYRPQSILRMVRLESVLACSCARFGTRHPDWRLPARAHWMAPASIRLPALRGHLPGLQLCAGTGGLRARSGAHLWILAAWVTSRMSTGSTCWRRSMRH